MVWLSSQPSISVIFLFFGSLGVFEEEQLKRIAVGLENSGHGFVWVVRNPSVKGGKGDKSNSVLAPKQPDLNNLLREPKGGDLNWKWGLISWVLIRV